MLWVYCSYYLTLILSFCSKLDCLVLAAAICYVSILNLSSICKHESDRRLNRKNVALCAMLMYLLFLFFLLLLVMMSQGAIRGNKRTMANGNNNKENNNIIKNSHGKVKLIDQTCCIPACFCLRTERPAPTAQWLKINNEKLTRTPRGIHCFSFGTIAGVRDPRRILQVAAEPAVFLAAAAVAEWIAQQCVAGGSAPPL